jgi:SWI/SNF-related matrix-associated actin-dependent regulator 1 of chromatin subfamily A
MEPGLELFLFQEEGMRFASDREGALIADEMGLGKSAQAIGVINEDPTIRKVIIRLSCQHANFMAPSRF